MEAESGARQPKSRRRLRRNDPASTKELILDEAARLIERQGVAEMMIKDIADAVGIRPPSVYKHFASREDVVARGVDHRALLLRVAPPEKEHDSLAACGELGDDPVCEPLPASAGV